MVPRAAGGMEEGGISKAARMHGSELWLCGNHSLSKHHVVGSAGRDARPRKTGTLVPNPSPIPHCRLRTDAILSNQCLPPGVVDEWPEWLRQEDDEDALDANRPRTQTGGCAELRIRRSPSNHPRPYIAATEIEPKMKDKYISNLRQR